MANITEYLKQIMSARYGKDVRQSIHDSIQAINEESSEVGQFSDQIEGLNEKCNDLSEKHDALQDETYKLSGVVGSIYTELSEKTEELQTGLETANTNIANTQQLVYRFGDTMTNSIEKKGSRIDTSADGHFLHLTDVGTRDFPLAINLYGKATQGGTSGKQLLPYPYINSGTVINNGVTSVINADGSIKRSGTATAFSELKLQSNLSFKAGTYYTNLSCYVSTGDYVGWWSGTRTFTSDFTVSSVSIQVASGTTVNDTFYPIISTGSTDFESYTGGIASPNPDYPQEVTVAGADGDIVLTSCVKNLLQITADKLVSRFGGVTHTDNSWSYNATGSSSAQVVNVYVEVEQNTDYAFSFTSHSSIASYGISFVDEISNTFVNINNKLQTGNSGTHKYSLLSWQISSGYSGTVLISDIQLEVGTVATPYERYRATTAIIPLTNGLAGIPVASGGNYTDESGQQWVCDTIEFVKGRDTTLNKGYYVQRILKTVFDGSSDEGWIRSATNTSDKYRFVVNKAVAQGTANSSKANIICTHYKVGTANMTYTCSECIAVDLANKIIIYNEAYSTSTLEEWKAYLATNPITVYAVLIEPITTSLTDEQMSALKEIVIYHLITNVFTDDICDVGMTYTADTKGYIDNKFNELATALLSAVGSEG